MSPKTPAALLEQLGAVCVVSSARQTYPQFAATLPLLTNPTGTILCWEFAGGGGVARARNALVEKALQRGARWICFIDDDHLFRPDTLRRLLAHDRDITVPLISTRQSEFSLVGWEHFEIPAELSDRALAKLAVGPRVIERLAPKHVSGRRPGGARVPRDGIHGHRGGLRALERPLVRDLANSGDAWQDA